MSPAGQVYRFTRDSRVLLIEDDPLTSMPTKGGEVLCITGAWGLFT